MTDLASELERLALAVQFLPDGHAYIEQRLAIVARLRELASKSEGRPRKWFKADRAS